MPSGAGRALRPARRGWGCRRGEAEARRDPGCGRVEMRDHDAVERPIVDVGPQLGVAYPAPCRARAPWCPIAQVGRSPAGADACRAAAERRESHVVASPGYRSCPAAPRGGRAGPTDAGRALIRHLEGRDAAIVDEIGEERGCAPLPPSRHHEPTRRRVSPRSRAGWVLGDDAAHALENAGHERCARLAVGPLLVGMRLAGDQRRRCGWLARASFSVHPSSHRSRTRRCHLRHREAARCVPPFRLRPSAARAEAGWIRGHPAPAARAASAARRAC